MNILAIGDIVGKTGLEKLKSMLEEIKTKYKIDFVVVNSENVSEGMGITRERF